MATITIRGKPVKIVAGTKADVARDLLARGYTVSEISKAVPMAYSQVHSIAKAVAPQESPRQLRTVAKKATTRYEAAVKRAETRTAHKVIEREKANEAAGRPVGAGSKYPRVGKLRTGNLPQDIKVGECANCGHDLVVRRAPTGFMFVHVNATTEEYLRTVQFCLAVPNSLVK
jgi:hypothetical protein